MGSSLKLERSITSSPLYKNLDQEEHYLETLHISASSILSDKCQREPCSVCGKSRMWFCYDCRLPVPSLTNVFPQVKLPFAVDIIKHRKELDAKSTGVHAALLSKDVTIYIYPEIPEYDPEKVLLIFPTEQNFTNFCKISSEINVRSMCRLCGKEHANFIFERIILVDCTWTQIKRIMLDERIAKLPNIAGISKRKSLFWRPQRNLSMEHLSTIEALHEACRLWLDEQGCSQVHQVDDILFFFKFFHDKISSRYHQRKQKLADL